MESQKGRIGMLWRWLVHANAKGIPKTLWDEAINTLVYVLNRCPTKAVKDMTPIEAWSGHKPTVNHFIVFGCLC